MNNVKFILSDFSYNDDHSSSPSKEVLKGVADLSIAEAKGILEILLSNLGNYKDEILEVVGRYYDIPSKGFCDDVKPIGEEVYFTDHNMLRSISPGNTDRMNLSGLYKDNLKFFIEVEKPQFVQNAITKYENKLKKNKERAQKQKIEKAKRALEKQGFKVTKA